MEHFIYVFNKQECDKLLALKYSLVKADESKNIYVFENRPDLQFDLNQIDAVFSSTLTF